MKRKILLLFGLLTLASFDVQASSEDFLVDLSQDNVRLFETIESLTAIVSRLEREKAELAELIGQQAESKFSAEIDCLQERIVSLTDSVSRLTQQRDSLLDKNQSAQTALHQDFLAVEKQIEDLALTCWRTDDSLLDNAKEIEFLHRSLSQQSEIYQRLQADYDISVGENNLLRAELSKRNSELLELQANFDNQPFCIDCPSSFKSEPSPENILAEHSLADDLGGCEEQLAKNDRQRDQVPVGNQEIEFLKTALDIQSEMYRKLQADYDKSVGENNLLSAELIKANRELENANRELRKANQANRELENANRELRKANQANRELRKANQANCELARKANLELGKANRELKSWKQSAAMLTTVVVFCLMAKNRHSVIRFFKNILAARFA